MIRWLSNTGRALLRLNSYLLERDQLRAERDAALAERDHTRRQAAAARAAALLVTVEAVALIRQAQQHAAGCQAMASALLEPGYTDACTKIRLRDEAQAEAFAAGFTADTGVRAEPYPCRLCPRQPVSLTPFWHITHADPTLRGQRGKADPPRRGSLLRHVDPATADAMRAVAAATVRGGRASTGADRSTVNGSRSS